jgi:C4-dicarboxylate transporter/malic acid transport protein
VDVQDSRKGTALFKTMSSFAPPTPLQEPSPETLITFQVHGLSQARNAMLLGHLLQRFSGVRQVRVDATTGIGAMRCTQVPAFLDVQQVLQIHGYTIRPHCDPPRSPQHALPFPAQNVQGALAASGNDYERRTAAAGQPREWMNTRTGSGFLQGSPGFPLREAQALAKAHGSLLVLPGETPRPAKETRPRAGKVRFSVLLLSVRAIRPAWFTSVMGTGILAICLTLAPLRLPFFAATALALWIGEVLLFSILLVLLLLQGLLFPAHLRASFQDSAQAQGWGAPPVACFTVATGFLLIGSHLLRSAVAVPFAQGFWVLGVTGSLFAAVIVPSLMMTSHELSTPSTAGNWLLPLAAPIVAAAPGALLAPTWPLALRSDLLALSYALWGLGLALSSILIVLFYARLLYHKLPALSLIPTLWIVVGPLGQSVASLNALSNVAPALWPAVGPVLSTAAPVYGLPVWGFGVYWLGLSLIVTVRAWRRLPFTLGWWAFVFPVGTLTAGTNGLYIRTHILLFAGAGVLFLCLLALMWTLVAARTLGHLGKSLTRGTHTSQPER